MPRRPDAQIRKALAWLADRRLEAPAAPREELVGEAARRFDLTPLDEELLLDAWREDWETGRGRPA